MILIKEVTAKELAELWWHFEINNPEPRSFSKMITTAQAVLNSLQVKADVEPRTLPDGAPSSSQSCSANWGVLYPNGFVGTLG